MKETKVYVDKLPKSCSECPCAHEDVAECKWCQAFSHGLLTYIPDTTYTKERLEDCPLIDIKTHDRELVKEVCEKIKLKFSDTRTHNWGIEQFELYEFLDQIQKEFEK